MERTEITMWRGVQAAAVLLVLGFFLLALRGVLNPFLLFLLLWALLSPFRGKPGHGTLLAVAGLLVLDWLLVTAGSVLAPFVLAVALAYILDPLVDRLEARRIPRVLAIAVLALPALALVAVLIFLGVPAAFHQLSQVAEEAPVLFQRLAAWLDGLRERLLRVDLPLLDEEALAARLRAVDSAAAMAFLEARREALAGWAWKSVLGMGRGVGAFLTIAGYVVLTPVLTFYLLRDWDRLKAAAADLVPEPRKDALHSLARDFDRLLGRYLRGQITVAACMGLITGAGLALLSFPYAAMLGLLVAVFNVVPYLGLVLSLVPALFLALVSGSVGASLLKVAVVYGAAQVLEGAFISPRIVGDSVGLHPVWVLLSLAVGGFYFGFVGLLISVPAAVGVKLLAVRGVARYRASELFRGEG
ncbi:MAG: AI-2E family transporter [Longimicrobiales bacterium]